MAKTNKETQPPSKKKPIDDKPIEAQAQNAPRRRGAGPNIEMIKKLQKEKEDRLEAERIEKEKVALEEQIEREKQMQKIQEEKEREAAEAEAEKERRKKKDVDAKFARKIGRLAINPEKKPEKTENKKKEVFLGDEKLRSPICCILGHVDTGKTKILDKIRESNVQAGEVGGITQQIGATYFPIENLMTKFKVSSNLPGILVIDTPGHESFSNLRSRGSSLCDLAILVVDVMHLLEPQTLESINLLKMRKTPFVVALNKIDRVIEGTGPKSFDELKPAQRKTADLELKTRINETIVKFAEIGLNARMFNDNPNPRKFISLVPTSAITGDGLKDLIGLILNLCESYMVKKYQFDSESFECVVLEVKNVEGHGSTIDCILVNGSLSENDKICVCGFDGPIVTRIKSILIPEPLKEMRVKNPFSAVKNVRASAGIKISAPFLEKAIAGSKVLKVTENEDEARKIVLDDFNSNLNSIETNDSGVHVQASTLGSLEALISFLKNEKIPIGSYSIGNVKKSDVLRASSSKNHKLLFCFDSEVEKELKEFAATLGVKIFEAKIIYHLLDMYKEFVKENLRLEKAKHLADSIFPCELHIVPQCVFTTRTPLVIGVEVKRGKLVTGIPVFVERAETIEKLGCVVSIEKNKKNVLSALKGDKVAIKIDSDSNDGCKMFGRHFIETDPIFSMITRRSIDILKIYFKDEIGEEEVKLIVELKNKLEIV